MGRSRSRSPSYSRNGDGPPSHRHNSRAEYPSRNRRAPYNRRGPYGRSGHINNAESHHYGPYRSGGYHDRYDGPSQVSHPPSLIHDYSGPVLRQRPGPIDDESLDIADTFLDGPMMTFKQYVLKKPDELSQEALNQGYQSYLSEYRSYHAERFFAAHYKNAFIRESYHPNLLREQFFISKNVAQYNALNFLQKLAAGVFQDLRLETDVAWLAEDISPLLLEEWPQDLPISDSALMNKEATDDMDDGELLGPVTYKCALMNPEQACLVVEGIDPIVSKFDIMKQLEKREPLFVAMVPGPLPVDPRTAYIYFANEIARDSAFDQGSEFQVIKVVTELDDKGDENEYLREVTLHLKLPEKEIPRRADITPPIACTAERLKADAKKSWMLIRALDEQLEVCGSDSRHPLEDALESIHDPWARLDLQITYLRHVHYLCYYSAKMYQDPQQLMECSGAIYVRPAIPEWAQAYFKCDSIYGEGSSMDRDDVADPTNVSPQQQRWVAQVEEKLDALSKYAQTAASALPPAVDEVTDSVIQTKWEAFCTEHTGKDSEGKYRCTLCHKLFKGSQFVQLHLRKKHDRELQNIIEKYVPHLMKKAYMADPNKAIMLPQASNRQHRRPLLRGAERRGNMKDGGYPFIHHRPTPGHLVAPFRMHATPRRRDWDAPTLHALPALSGGNLRQVATRVGASYDDL